MRIIGRLISYAGVPIAGWLVRAEDELLSRYSFPATETGDDGQFMLESSTTLAPRAQPQLTFYISEGDRPVQVVEPALSWSRAGSAEVEIVVSAPPPPVFYLYGRVRNAAPDAGAGGLTVEAVDRGGGFEPQQVESGTTGLFEIWWPYEQEPQPVPQLRILRGQAAVPSHTAPFTWGANRDAAVSVELVWSISGAVVDRATGEGVASARVEAWDAADVWLADADADATGAFNLHLPRRSGQTAPPQPTFRVYRDDRLAETVEAQVPWDDEGFATVQLRIGNETRPLPTI